VIGSEEGWLRCNCNNATPGATPATFTVATAIGALELAKQGVLVTRLSAIEEAAGMDVLCNDKTGAITKNELEVAAHDFF
jgi:H+-transporting ATPase